MSSSSPTAVTRHRPAILVLAGAAAAYGAYLLYYGLQAAPGDGLHRSNAVRRAHPQRRPSRTTRIISRLEGEVGALGEYSILGLVVPLDPRNLIAPDELRELLVPMAPGATEDTIHAETAQLYDVFLDRLLDSAFSSRPLAPAEIEAVTRWVGHRLPNPATVSRAVERRTQRLNDTRPDDADGAESVAATDISWNSDDDTDGDAVDPDGQTLQRTLYHIAEDRARQEGVIHRGITCNACDEKPIRGTRWHCANCVDFDLCSTCEATNAHTRTHVFYKIRVPAPYLSLAKQEPLYPGKPHMMHHSVNSTLKRRLASETKMEVEEIEALWDQFTCLASTEWPRDPNKVGWALDRRAFNHAFVPRYNGFIAAPNLIYDRIFTYYDTDKNGLIGFEEWIKGIDGMHTTDIKIKARIVFNGYDIDGDGYISRRDVLRVFRAYYAIEKEATRNFVAELTEELSVHNGMDTIRSSQPLGSAFPPNSLATSNTPHVSFAQKQNGTFDETSPVVLDTDFEIDSRISIIKADEISQLLEGSSSEGAGERLVEKAWSRREFTLDEEEGLARPKGVKETNDGEDTANDFAGSAGKESVSKQWGGYEIPELEQDLGKEVLYQVTQQAFNELLDPLFRAREDMALDARNLRSERRKHAEAIDAQLEKQKGWGKYNPTIARMGIFRFVKGVIDVFCQHLNMGSLEAMKRHTYEDDPEWYASMVRTAIEAAEELVLKDVKIRNENPPLVDVAEWNAELVKEQLYQELVSATIRLLNPSGRLTSERAVPNTEQPSLSSESMRDPTMPQFRPNSTANVDSTAPADLVEEPLQDASASEFEHDLEEFVDEDGRVRIGPSGPFFVSSHHPSHSLSWEAEQADKLTTPTVTPPPGMDFRDSEGHLIDASGSPRNAPVAPRPSRDFSQQEGEDSSSAAAPKPTPAPEGIKFPHVSNTPWLQTLCLAPSPTGTQTISYTRRHVAHTQNMYAIASEPDQTAALMANIRRSAKNPDSPLYIRLLASCGAVEQESRKRRGDGLLSFDEFEEVLRDGRLRFLESWMDWVSL